ncbi:hypothetical protein GCM10017673_33980 [Streptosporangium violaceochromogenes]|nr:hypothetical protein GCM10017673_33980 [Streptosporangium violaceochromogenes]
MSEFVAGTVVVPVVPSAKGFIDGLKKQLVPAAYNLGQTVGKDVQRGIQDALGGIYAPLQEQTKKQRQQAPRDGEETGGAFAQGFKKRLTAALKTLPKAELDADASPAARKVQELRSSLVALSGKTVGVDVDAAAAVAELRTIKAELESLDGSADVAVRADVAAALVQLGAVDAEVSRLEADTARVQVDADAAGAVAQLTVVDAEISRVDGRTAHARVDVDVAGALAGIATVTAALVAVPAAATAAFGVGALGGTLVAAGAGFAGLAAVAVPSLKRISEASKEQEQAVKASAGATKVAQQATTSAAQAAADAASRSAALEQAERRITDAKVAAKAAEEGLTEARRAAKQAAEDLARSVANAALSEESAALSVEEARQRAAELAADPKATELERRRAELAVREAEQCHKDAKARSKELQAEQKASDKAGVEGSKQVVAAKEKIAKANQAIKDSEAQLKLLRLQQAAAKEKPKTPAPAAVAPGVQPTKFSELSAAAKTAAKQIDAFKSSYEKWQKSLEPSVLPMVTGGLKIVKGLFKPLTPLIKNSADAVVGLEKSASKALGQPFWKGFFADLSKQAPTAITGLGKSLGNIGVGVAGVIRAFLPFVPTIVGGIQKATAAFATWGKGLSSSGGFQAFVAYVKANAPAIGQTLKNVGAAVGNIVATLARFGPSVLAGLSGLAGLISQIPPSVLGTIAGAIASIVVAVKGWGIAQQVLNVAMSENPVGKVIAVIGLLVTAFVAAYQNSETFRTIVDTAFKKISEVVKWAWETVVKPALSALGTFVKTVLAPAVSWLWENVVKPAFTKIGEWIKTAWNTVIHPALKALWTFINETLAPKISWLYENVVKPVWAKVGEAIDGAWTKVIKPAFDFLKKAVTEDIPNGFDKGVGLIKTAWEKVQDVAKKPVNFIIETVYNNGIVKLWNTVSDALGLDLKLGKIEKLAKGGIYPGYTPGKDIGLAAVSGGEAIMRPEWTRAVGADYVHSANKAARTGGVSGAARFMGGFASGGIVGDLLAKGVKAGAEAFLNPLLAKAEAAMGGSKWAKLLVGVPKKMVADVVKFLAGKEEATGGLSGGKAVAFARAQIGKPYQWGATGPNTFDCSGLTMRALQAAGYNPPRVSQDQMRWVTPVSKPQAGYLGFPHSGHVWLYSGPNRIIEAPQTGLKVREVAARAAQVIGKPPAAYDNGGYLMPGTSLVHNGTGRPEPVLTDKQWQAVFQGGGSRGGDGALVHIEGGFHATPEQSPYAIAEDLRFIMGRGLRSRG